MNDNMKYDLSTPIVEFRFHVKYETYKDIERLGIITLRDLISLEISSIVNNNLIDRFSKLEIVYLVHSLGYKFKDETVLFDTKDHEQILISLDTPIEKLSSLLSSRTSNGLRRMGIETLGDLVSKNKSDLLKVIHFGPKSLRETILFLNLLGYTFDEETEHKEQNVVSETSSIQNQIAKREQENKALSKKIEEKRKLLQRYQELIKQRNALIEEEKALDNEIAQALQKLSHSVAEQGIQKIKQS